MRTLRRRAATLLLVAPLAAGATCEYRTAVAPAGGRAVDDAVLAALDATGDAPSADVPDGSADAADGSGAADRCDLTGTWAVRQLAFNQDSIIGAIQAASEWYVATVRDDGDTFEVTDSFYCGVEVSGSASVVMVAEALPAAVRANSWAGRRGTFAPAADSDGCAFELEPLYLVLGARRADYVPAGEFVPLDTLRVSHPLPSEGSADGAQDWDGDGVPGVAFRVSGAVNGRRNAVQRYWYRYFSEAPDYIPAGDAAAFVVRAELDQEENLLAVEGCDPLCGLLRAGSIVSPGSAHRAYFTRIGRNAAEVEASSLWDGDDEIETCFRVRDAVPHEPTTR